MQKRWKMLITLMLALVLLMTSVCAEGAGEDTSVLPGQQENQEESGAGTVTEPTAAPAPTATATAVPAATATPAPAATATAVPAATATPASTATATAVPAATATPAPTATATRAPAVTAAPTATVQTTKAPAQGTTTPTAAPVPGDDTAEEQPKNSETPADVVAEPETDVQTWRPGQAESRTTWVALNISLHWEENLKAQAALGLTQLLLARSVADGMPVGVCMMEQKRDPLYHATVTSAEEWTAMMGKVKEGSFAGNNSNAVQFGDLLALLKGMHNKTPLGKIDVWVLETEPQGSLGITGQSNSQWFSANEDFAMYFQSFQKRDERLAKNSKWLLEEIQARNMSNFYGEPFYYEDFVKNPLPVAMELLGLNLLAPYTEMKSRTDEKGDLIWEHAGLDTLLMLTTREGGITVTADQTLGGERAFPIVMEMGERRYMVLLRNVTPGTYRISGQVEDLKVAYDIDHPEVALVGAPVDGTAMEWKLEEQELVVSLNIPQLKSRDATLLVYINDMEVDVTEVKEFDGETGIQWTIRVPRQSLGPGVIRFKAVAGDGTVADFVVESPDYTFVVEDRPLTLAGEERADFVYYYNVPGVEEQPVTVNMAQYFYNPDEQELAYDADAAEFSIEADVFSYQRQGNMQDCEWQLQVTDGVSDAVPFTIGMKHVDFFAVVENWTVQSAATAYEGTLNEETTITFTLPAEAAQLYAQVRVQYPELPENLEDALQIYALLTDHRYPNGHEIPVVLTAQEDGSIQGQFHVPAYQKKEDDGRITFDVLLLNQSVSDQRMIPEYTIRVANDSPVLAEGIAPTLAVKANIKGAPGKRSVLTIEGINAAQKNEEKKLPAPFVPSKLFFDVNHVEGLTITIKAEPAALVKLMRYEADPETDEPKLVEVEAQDGVWVLEPDFSETPHEIHILDKGEVTLNISAYDGENPGLEEITWTVKVGSSYDTTVLIVSILAALLAITAIVLLVLRQIRKPSFARMNSEAYMCVCTNYSPNGTFSHVPMSIYGKKETDLAHLFIACQQPPVRSMPIDVLADVAVQPGKRRTYRLVLGRRAEGLNIVVGDQAQNTQKPVTFGPEQMVRVYSDLNEVLFLQINSER